MNGARLTRHRKSVYHRSWDCLLETMKPAVEKAMAMKCGDGAIRPILTLPICLSFDYDEA